MLVWRILKSQKIRSIFYTECTLRKLFFKPTYRVATEDKNSIVYETDFCNCEAVYFGESKQSLKSRLDERKRSVRNCDWDKNEITKHCCQESHICKWYQKKLLIKKASWFLGRWKKPYIIWRILITLTKVPTYFLKYGFLMYGSS